MRIDHSLPEYTKYYLCLDANVRYGVRHMGLACSCELSLSIWERIGHIILGILELIPVIGHVLVGLEHLLCGRIKVLHLDAQTPYERGQQHGRALKNEIQEIYSLVMQAIEDRRSGYGQRKEFDEKVDVLQRHISEDTYMEMSGLADAAEVPLENVFAVHAFLDIYAGIYGCSALATRSHDRVVNKITTTNHFENSGQWCERQNALNQFNVLPSAESHREAIGTTSVDDTIQSVVFDVNALDMHMATAWGDAAGTGFTQWSATDLFSQPVNQSEEGADRVFLARNLDWPWAFLAPYTTLIVTEPGEGKKKFVNVSFPGYLGVLTGMNEDGVALAACQSGSSKQDGVLVTFLFRDILERAGSCSEALEIIEESSPASSMNLTIAGRDRICAVEIDPRRAQVGYALLKASYG